MKKEQTRQELQAFMQEQMENSNIIIFIIFLGKLAEEAFKKQKTQEKEIVSRSLQDDLRAKERLKKEAERMKRLAIKQKEFNMREAKIKKRENK